MLKILIAIILIIIGGALTVLATYGIINGKIEGVVVILIGVATLWAGIELVRGKRLRDVIQDWMTSLPF